MLEANFKETIREHKIPIISGLLIIATIAATFYLWYVKKPDYGALSSSFSAGDYQSVIGEAESLLERNKNDVGLAHILAAAYLAEGVVSNNKAFWVGKAHELLLSMTEKLGEDSESERLIGYGYFLLNDYGNAQTYYQNSAILNPNSALAWANLGQLFETKRDFTKATSYYNKALSINDDNALANLGKIRQLMREKNYDKASTKANLFLSTNPDRLSSATAHEILAQIELQDREFDKAERHFNQALLLNGSRAVSLAGLALSIIGQIPNHVMRSMKEETAIPLGLAKRAVALEPDSAYGYVVLAKIAKLRGDDASYKTYSKKILSLVPADDTISPVDKTALYNEYSSSAPTITNIKIISVKKVESSSGLGIKVEKK